MFTIIKYIYIYIYIHNYISYNDTQLDTRDFLSPPKATGMHKGATPSYWPNDHRIAPAMVLQLYNVGPQLDSVPCWLITGTPRVYMGLW